MLLQPMTPRNVSGCLQISVNGKGLINLNNGTVLVQSCSSKDSEQPDCKCADSRVTSSDINWYANNIPWNVDKMSYAKTTCTETSRGGPQCEDWFVIDVQEFTNFNRDNSGGTLPTVYFVYRHFDGSMLTTHSDIVLKRVEGTIDAAVTVTFTVTINSQTMAPLEVRSV